MYFPRLRDMREEMGLTQEDLCDVLEIRQTVYSRYERGFQNIPLELLIKLSEYYEVSTDYLLSLTDNRQRNE